ncbi:MAG: hypothetical protein GXP26_07075 [Planctomycetes bacterium]|nr:hypothetical protein [Planctomycetota bacterium]
MSIEENEDQAKRISEAVYKATYAATRQAVADEILVYHTATVGPAIEMVLEMQQTLKLIADGQILVEKHLADRGDDSEPWRESLEDD